MSFQLANLTGQSLPAVDELVVADAEVVFEKGSLLLIVSGELTECGTNPTEVDGVSLSGYGTLALDPSGIPSPQSVLGARGIPPGYMQFIRPRKGLRFSAEFIGDVDAASVGTFYGVTKDTDDKWKVDFTKTGNDVVELISKDWNRMLAYEYEHESVEQTTVKGRNRVIVEFIPSVTEAE